MQAPLAPSESSMWDGPERPDLDHISDAEINKKYSRRELRIVTESNREQLPNFVQAFRRQEELSRKRPLGGELAWMDIRPFYQRRARWSRDRQSKLIESFIMNVPVPPLFVYESELARYEVMDGQQRITAILDFYGNKLTLEGLEQWPELNGRTYNTLPSEIRSGIDRRSISYTVLLKESASSSEEQILLRQQVFERLNTGGVALTNQEVRNSIYQSRFSALLDELSSQDAFRDLWNIPRGRSDETGLLPALLARNIYYSTMRDTEIILRFFALRQVDKYKYGMKNFLDRYMFRAKQFTDYDITYLKQVFEQTLTLAYGLFGDHLFRPWDHKEWGWSERPQIALADAQMVACARHLGSASLLMERKQQVMQRTQDLLKTSDSGQFTGQKNTKADVQGRIDAFDELLADVESI